MKQNKEDKKRPRNKNRHIKKDEKKENRSKQI